MDEQTARFETERPRLTRIAERLLGDHAEAEDAVQNTWIRLARNETPIDNLPGWLTTVTTRLCLDRLRGKLPAPEEDLDLDETAPDPADDVVLADTVGSALQVVLDRLTPSERVAFVLHDSFAVDFPAVANILGVSPVAARKLASRARRKVADGASPDSTVGRSDHSAVVDAFLHAAKSGDLDALLGLLAPEVILEGADAAAVALGTARLVGRDQVVGLVNGGMKTAFPVFIGGRPGVAWLHRGEFKVAFDFVVTDGVVQRIELRAAPEVLAITRRR
ncbi:sigma-70 family RNA polymerase sigma factor [Flexivirga oryzae]|uniref:RNA polymerase sigma-70 factor (ECF subfamily) n=1 Tax=Flexivirga oryzae TaxID=1794944 RepID=A0A839N5D4_9MICO|nr:sigma-70 family RNA polymerase sigma factor [Flexivirga oryzae]MBB2892958.1 RNA polymerase sigma-70 factor (ECF subfamily) [Flexivirga oryzae]